MGKKGGGGGSNTTTYAQSPEARQMMEYMMPAVQKIGQAGAAGKPLYQVPGMPDFTGAPDVQSMMPQQGWFSGLDKDIMSGISEPWEYGAQQLEEQMGAGGMGGSARGGWSGAAGAGLGKFWENASRGMGQQAWGMMQPGLQAGWQAELGMAQQQNQQAMQGWQAQLQAMRDPFTAIPGMAGGAMPTPVMQPSGGGGKK